jgi:hypothetical protein
LYGLWLGEISDEERAKYQKENEERAKYQQKGPEIPADRIGAFSLRHNRVNIDVPPHFMDALWTAALATDGALRRIELIIGQLDSEVWNVFEATLTEELAEPFELPVDEGGRRKVMPPRADPVVAELRALKLRPQWRSWVSGIAIIAAGVLLALLIAKLWR